MSSIRATISIPKELAIKISEMSKNEDRSFANQIVVLVKKALKAEVKDNDG